MIVAYNEKNFKVTAHEKKNDEFPKDAFNYIVLST